MDNAKKQAIVNTLGKDGEIDRFYVYALCEEKNGKYIPFYIGKGQGERIWQHEEETEKLKNALKKEYGIGHVDLLKLKHQKIDGLKERYCPIIIKWGLTESEAFMAESALINLLKIMPDMDLANIANGHASKKEKDKNQTTQACTLEGFNCKEPLDIHNSKTKKALADLDAIFININKYYGLCLNSGIGKYEDSIMDATRGTWYIGKDKEPKHIFSVYQSKICGIYEVSEKIYIKDITAEALEKLPKFPKKTRLAEKEILKTLLEWGSNGKLPKFEDVPEPVKSKCCKLRTISEDDTVITENHIKNFDKYQDFFQKSVSEEQLKSWLGRAFFCCKPASEDLQRNYLSRIIRNDGKSIFVRCPTRYVLKDNANDEDQEDKQNFVADSE